MSRINPILRSSMYKLPIANVLTLAIWLSWGVCLVASAQNNVQWVDGSITEATIVSISTDGTISGDGVPAGVKLDQIVGYQVDAATKPPGAVEVLVAGRGKLFTNSVVIQDSVANIESTWGTAVQLPLDVIQAIVFKRTQRVNKQLADPSDSADTVIVDTPDGEKVVAGIFEGLGQGKLGLNFNGKSRKIGLEKINAVSLADLGLEMVTGTLVELSDGSLLRGQIRSVDGGVLTFALTSNHTIEIPWASVNRLEVQSDNLVYLSNLEPAAVEQKSMFAPERDWQRDRSVDSNPIRLQVPDKSSPYIYRKGIGTHSYCKLEFANTNDFERFQALAGIDAETNGRGDCRMSVYADGIKLWSKRITGQTPPEKIDVDISGMAKITLIVEPGEQFDLADHADWADAKFVKH